MKEGGLRPPFFVWDYICVLNVAQKNTREGSPIGFFSKKKKKRVSATTVPLAENTPKVVESAIYKAIGEQTPMSSTIQDEILKSAGVRGYTLFNYARRKSVLGLPSSNITGLYPSNGGVEAAIRKETGERVEIDYNYIDKTDEDFFAAWKLTSEGLKLNIDTGKLSGAPAGAPSFTYHYLVDGDVTSDTQLRINLFGTNSSAPSATNSTKYSLTYTVSDVFRDEYYYYAVYHVMDSRGAEVGDPIYWYYCESTDLYPALTLQSDDTRNSQFFPVIPVRVDNQNLWEDKYRYSSNATTAQRWKDSKRMLKILSADFVTLGENLAGTPEDPQDTESLDYVYCSLSVWLLSNVQESMHYIWKYFKYLKSISVVSDSDYNNWASSDNGAVPTNVLNVKESGGFNSNTTWSGITITQAAGVLKRDEDNEVVVGHMSRSYAVNTSRDGDTVQRLAERVLGLPTYSMSRQINKTTIETVMVRALQQSIRVAGKTVSVAPDSGDDDDQKFTLPLHYTTMRTFNMIDATTIHYDAYRMHIYSLIIEEVSWYETGIGKVFIMVVTFVIAVVITIVTLGVGIPVAAALVAINMAIVYAVTVAVTLVLDVLGIENVYVRAVIQIIAIIFTPTVGYDSDTQKFIQEIHTGVTMTQAVSAVGQLNAAHLKVQIQDIQAKYETLEEQQEALDEFNDEFYTDYSLITSAFVQDGMEYRVRESTEEFYARTLLHNPGVLVFKEPSQYVDLKLTLPGVADTSGFNTTLIG